MVNSPAIPRSVDPAWYGLITGSKSERSSNHIHLVGIGGSGLSAIAVLLLQRGFVVSGSDHGASEVIADLEAQGATVSRGHAAQNIGGADLVLVSSAVPPDNVEVQAALAAGIPVVKRNEFFRPLMAGQHGIGVAGSHGKSTTTGMIATILYQAGLDPSFVIGAHVELSPRETLQDPRAGRAGLAVAGRAGQGPFVIEADEYDGMFLGLPLETAVVTYVEWDHVDCYPTPKAFGEAFRRFAGQLPPHGRLVLCADDPGSLALADAAVPGVHVSTYGLSPNAVWRAQDLKPNEMGGLSAEIWHHNQFITSMALAVPGLHNVRNALAAVVACQGVGVSPEQAAKMLARFKGAGRRFELIGEGRDVLVIDDYGHHPTEIATTLAAARLRFPTRRLWAVFQPHTFSRTAAFIDQFARCFVDADHVILLDIYASREKDDLGMESRLLLARMDHPSAHYLGTIELAAEYLLRNVTAGDVVITLSAGDGNRVGRLLLEGLS